MANGAELTCNSCKQRVALNSMKYSKDGTGLICENCLNKQNNGVSLRIKPQTTFTKPSDSLPKKKVKYSCKMCRYQFERALDFRGPRLCPNCGREDIMYNLPNDADDLLKELDDI